jgi:hypothetical protein
METRSGTYRGLGVRRIESGAIDGGTYGAGEGGGGGHRRRARRRPYGPVAGATDAGSELVGPAESLRGQAKAAARALDSGTGFGGTARAYGASPNFSCR